MSNDMGLLVTTYINVWH